MTVSVSDKCRQWTVVVACSALQIYTGGCEYMFGILLVELLQEYDEGESALAWVGSVHLAVFCLSGLIITPLRFYVGWSETATFGSALIAIGLLTSALTHNVSTLYFTYGFLIGAGCGMHYVASTVRSLEVSGNMKTVASGIASAGTALGMILVGQVRGVTMNRLGWRKGLLVEMAFLGISLPCGFLLKIRTAEEDALEEEESEYTLAATSGVKSLVDFTSIDKDRTSDDYSDASLNGHDDQRTKCDSLSLGEKLQRLLTDVVFYLTLLCALLVVHPMYASIHYLPSLAETHLNLTPQEVSSLTTVAGVVSLVTRVIMGVIGNRDVEVRYVLYVGINVISAASSCFISLWSTFHLMIVYAALSGAMIATVASLYPVLLSDLFGLDSITLVIYFVAGVCAFSYLIGFPLLGLVVETSRYKEVYLVIGLLHLASCVVCLVIPIITRVLRKR